MALEELFTTELDPTPPEARRWEAVANGRRMACELLRRRDGLSWEPARLQVSFPDTNLPPEQPVPWDRELDDWLLSHAVRAVTPRNEAERFGYRLDALFEPVLDRYADGYFNSVLVTYLNESELGTRAGIRAKLAAVHAQTLPPSREALDCRARIKQVLATTAQTLGSLYGDRALAETILCDAIAYYLDDRFSISMRAALGIR
jgi:hypothetical protein